jgi:hypothetical protein
MKDERALSADILNELLPDRRGWDWFRTGNRELRVSFGQIAEVRFMPQVALGEGSTVVPSRLQAPCRIPQTWKSTVSMIMTCGYLGCVFKSSL